jgi:hypothetical protein
MNVYIQLYAFSTSAPDEDEWSVQRFGTYNPGERSRYALNKRPSASNSLDLKSKKKFPYSP